jgi:hypothetical protein
MLTKKERVRALNDQLRTTGKGGGITMTRSLVGLGPEIVEAVVTAVQTFSSFTPANDPHGEHDFASLMVAGHQVMFKIDYYNTTMRDHSPDPSDPAVTHRILTIMLDDDY